MGFERKAGEQILLKVEVEDTGIGIKESDMDKLFLNFTRVDEQKNRNIQGTGLGLSLTKNLVELMGGKIHVTSEYGKGSVFTATIPQQIANPEPLGDFAQNISNIFIQQSWIIMSYRYQKQKSWWWMMWR